MEELDKLIKTEEDKIKFIDSEIKRNKKQKIVSTKRLSELNRARSLILGERIIKKKKKGDLDVGEPTKTKN